VGKITLSDIMELSIPERILLVEEIWDSIAKVEESVPLASSQCEKLDQRVEAYYRNENTVNSWKDVKHRTLFSASRSYNRRRTRKEK